MTTRILTFKEDDLCLKYSENPEYLQELMQEITVKTKYVGYDYYFLGDKDKRDIIQVFIKKGDTTISFKFGMSLNDTGNYDNVDDLLYTILASVASDYYIPDDYTDFISEFGYDDNSDTKKLHRKCVVHAEKLHKIFTDEDIEALPR